MRKFNLFIKSSQTLPSPLTGEGEDGGVHGLPPPTSILPRKGGGGPWGCPIYNSRGISVLFLVIAMMLMVSIGYVLSYLIPTKQKSVSLAVSSNQAFFLAQSGVEFAVRYASDNGLSSLSSPITRNLGRGSFTITYEPTPVDRLTSDGQIPNTSQRRIVVRNFSQFVTLSPCWITSNQVARFYITNESPSNVTLNAFEASWTHTGSQTTRLREISMGLPGGALTQRFSGNLNTPIPTTNLNSTQLISPAQTLEINVRWQNPRVSGFTITFYSTTGGVYTFNFASGLLNCP